MSTMHSTILDPPGFAEPPPTMRRFSVAEYERLAELGARFDA
jgi:hypothetical protein